tara:strand:- start:2105 stop:2323 length:219 start_codon:yes stop_codon:yes gene_type:complete
MSTEQNRNAYELRTDLLGMAMGLVSDGKVRLEQNEHFKAEGDNDYQRQSIAPYTAEEVIAVAEKLYQFVQTK